MPCKLLVPRWLSEEHRTSTAKRRPLLAVLSRYAVRPTQYSENVPGGDAIVKKRSGSFASRHLRPAPVGRRRHPPAGPPRRIVGLAWYEASQWSRLLELADDRDALDDTYEQWRQSAANTMVTLATQGVILRPVAIDPDEVAAWCREQGRPFDGAARSEFTAESMRNGTARYLDEASRTPDVRRPERVAEQRDAADEVRDGQRRRGPRS